MGDNPELLPLPSNMADYCDQVKTKLSCHENSIWARSKVRAQKGRFVSQGLEKSGGWLSLSERCFLSGSQPCDLTLLTQDG